MAKNNENYCPLISSGNDNKLSSCLKKDCLFYEDLKNTCYFNILFSNTKNMKEAISDYLPQLFDKVVNIELIFNNLNKKITETDFFSSFGNRVDTSLEDRERLDKNQIADDDHLKNAVDNFFGEAKTTEYFPHEITETLKKWDNFFDEKVKNSDVFETSELKRADFSQLIDNAELFQKEIVTQLEKMHTELIEIISKNNFSDSADNITEEKDNLTDLKEQVLSKITELHKERTKIIENFYGKIEEIAVILKGSRDNSTETEQSGNETKDNIQTNHEEIIEKFSQVFKSFLPETDWYKGMYDFSSKSSENIEEILLNIMEIKDQLQEKNETNNLPKADKADLTEIEEKISSIFSKLNEFLPYLKNLDNIQFSQDIASSNNNINQSEDQENDIDSINESNDNNENEETNEDRTNLKNESLKSLKYELEEIKKSINALSFQSIDEKLEKNLDYFEENNQIITKIEEKISHLIAENGNKNNNEINTTEIGDQEIKESSSQTLNLSSLISKLDLIAENTKDINIIKELLESYNANYSVDSGKHEDNDKNLSTDSSHSEVSHEVFNRIEQKLSILSEIAENIILIKNSAEKTEIENFQKTLSKYQELFEQNNESIKNIDNNIGVVISKTDDLITAVKNIEKITPPDSQNSDVSSNISSDELKNTIDKTTEKIDEFNSDFKSEISKSLVKLEEMLQAFQLNNTFQQNQMELLNANKASIENLIKSISDSNENLKSLPESFQSIKEYLGEFNSHELIIELKNDLKNINSFIREELFSKIGGSENILEKLELNNTLNQNQTESINNQKTILNELKQELSSINQRINTLPENFSAIREFLSENDNSDSLNKLIELVDKSYSLHESNQNSQENFSNTLLEKIDLVNTLLQNSIESSGTNKNLIQNIVESINKTKESIESVPEKIQIIADFLNEFNSHELLKELNQRVDHLNNSFRETLSDQKEELNTIFSKFEENQSQSFLKTNESLDLLNKRAEEIKNVLLNDEHWKNLFNYLYNKSNEDKEHFDVLIKETNELKKHNQQIAENTDKAAQFTANVSSRLESIESKLVENSVKNIAEELKEHIASEKELIQQLIQTNKENTSQLMMGLMGAMEELKTSIDSSVEVLIENKNELSSLNSRLDEYHDQNKIILEQFTQRDIMRDKEKNRERIENLTNEAMMYFKTGNYDSAEKKFLEALDIDNSISEIHNNLGFLYSQKGENEKAVESFTKAIEINPNYLEALNNLGFEFFLKKEYEKAKNYFTKIIKKNMAFVPAYYNLSEVLFEIGSTAKAVEILERALTIEPNNIKIKNRLNNYKKFLNKE